MLMDLDWSRPRAGIWRREHTAIDGLLQHGRNGTFVSNTHAVLVSRYGRDSQSTNVEAEGVGSVGPIWSGCEDVGRGRIAGRIVELVRAIDRDPLLFQKRLRIGDVHGLSDHGYPFVIV